MHPQPLITVIVPVYNVEAYLDRCVASLVNQTYENLEILLIDDGSTDRCPELCDAWARRDHRITVFHTENRGLAHARNLGLDHAHGAYLAFADSDDYVDAAFLQVLYDTLVSQKVRMSVIGFQCFFSGEEPDTHRAHNWDVRVYSTEEAFACMYTGEQFADYAWNKLYCAELFSGIRYPVGRKMEDIGTTCRLVGQCRRIAYNPAPLYFYCQRPGSIVRSWDEQFARDRFDMLREKYRYIRERCPGLLINRLVYFRELFERFPGFSRQERRQAAAEAAGLWQGVKGACSLKMKLKYAAMQTVPGLYAWNKRRNNLRCAEKAAKEVSPDSGELRLALKKQWQEAEQRRADPLQHMEFYLDRHRS